MQIFLVVLHVFICFMIILVVLLQPGKGEIGGAFGGSQALFGGRGPVSFLSKATWAGVAVFMFTSILLSIYSKRNAFESSVIDMSDVGSAQTKSAPAETKTDSDSKSE